MTKNIVYTLCIFFITSIPLYGMLKETDKIHDQVNNILMLTSMETEVSLSNNRGGIGIKVEVKFSDIKRKIIATLKDEENNSYLRIVGAITYFTEKKLNGVNNNDRLIMNQMKKLSENLFIAHKELMPSAEIEEFKDKKQEFEIVIGKITVSN